MKKEKETFKQFLVLYEDRVKYAVGQFEAKLDAAREKDSSAREYDSATALVQAIQSKIDPTKAKQHVVWLSRMYSRGEYKMEDADRLKADLQLFEKAKPKLANKDLNSYKTLGELYDALKPFEGASEEDLSSKKEKVAKVKGDAEVFIDEKDLKVVIPKTHEASCVYGSGTKWCTASGDTAAHFESYTKKGPLFILLATFPDGTKRKFQLHYEDSAFMDERDQAIGKKDLAELYKLKGYREFIEKLMKKHYHPHAIEA